jgi:hypothetical protein
MQQVTSSKDVIHSAVKEFTAFMKDKELMVFTKETTLLIP